MTSGRTLELGDSWDTAPNRVAIGAEFRIVSPEPAVWPAYIAETRKHPDAQGEARACLCT